MCRLAASSPSFDAEHTMEDVQAPAAQAHQRPKVGISLTLSLNTTDTAMADKPLYIHLSYQARVLSINVRTLSKVNVAHLDGLAWFLRTNIIILHASPYAYLGCMQFEPSSRTSGLFCLY